MWTAVAGVLATAILAWRAPSRVHGWTPSPDQPFPVRQAAPPLPALTRHDSVVVFAAHPDDETLGAGGLLHAAAAAGARVDVVFFTNGDGFLEGVDVGFRTLLSTPARFLEYGRRRQREAIRAAAQLGLAPDHLTFLGYPDRGLAVLWGPAWDCDRPYTSPYTRRSRSPYALSFRRGAAYCGRSLLDDLERVLERDRPSLIVTHSPDDTHRDHRAAGAFAMAALEQLRMRHVPWTRTVRVLPYLVHRGRWPQPEAYAPDLPLVPPADLAAAAPGWVEFPLRPADEAAKRAAVLEYHTQVQLLRAYLLSFVRRDELFGPPPESMPDPVDAEALSIALPARWDRLPTLMAGPPGDLLARATGSLRIGALALGEDPERLLIAIRLRRAAMREAQYRVTAAVFYRGGGLRRLRLIFRPPGSLAALRTEPRDLALPAGAVARSFGPRIHIAVPLDALRRPASLLLDAETLGPLRRPVERSPWILVRLGRGPDLRTRACGSPCALRRTAGAPMRGTMESATIRGGLPE
jgi:LmbE family N-acetylglucosaminyl deacetylase